MDTVAPSPTTQPLVEVRAVSKSFGATRALRDVDLALHAGKVHALLGANGCGKSTLVKILAGYHVPDGGEVRHDGAWTSAAASDAAAPIAFVHQDLGLVPTLSVTENLRLGSGFRLRGGAIDWRGEHRDAARLAREFGIGCDVREPVGALGPAEQTMVAIARAVSILPEAGGVLVLDEPTARLPATEADRLIAMVRNLRRRGVAILYITHRLEEVIAMADEVTVLRDGARIHHGAVADIDRVSLVRMIVGGEIEHRGGDAALPRELAAVVLETDALCGFRVHNLDLRMTAGELFGIAGLVGSGRSELGRLLFGLQRPLSGRVRLDGADVAGLATGKMVARGAAYVPQERRQGIVAGLSVGENAILADYPSVMGRFGVSAGRLRAAAVDVVRTFQVKTAGIEAPIETLSGGNQQKVSLGKWLRRDVRLLILDEPTQGIDIGARTEIFRIIRALARERGFAVLVLDSDLEILAEHCDRVAVMAAGVLGDELAGRELSISALNHAVYGH